MGEHVNYWGVIIAVIGFVLTRFTVTLAYENAIRFYLAGVLPLLLGLGLAAFGVALAVADVDAVFVRTTALWCVAGTSAMLALVALTLLGSTGGLPDPVSVRSRVYLSNFLIGGSVGGTMTGIYAARNHRQQDRLEQQANRLSVLNRLLRHEVLNAVTIIRGYAGLDPHEHDDAEAVIEERSDAIKRTIEEVKFLTPERSAPNERIQRVNLADSIEASVAAVEREYPDADIRVESVPPDVTVRANGRLERAVTHLIENGVSHTDDDDPVVTVSVTTIGDQVEVSVTDRGPGLPPKKQALLERGEIGEFDDPESGFGLNIVRLLVDGYGGRIETDVSDAGTTITVTLIRGDDPGASRPLPASIHGLRPALPQLVVIVGAALVAGVAYGITAILLEESIAGIGIFYGKIDPLVGWITHEFHSVVFGFVFAGLLTIAPAWLRDVSWGYVAIAVAWGLTLWLVAAGVIAPVWLRLQEQAPIQIPNLTANRLAYHLAWGLTLGVTTKIGYDHVTPRLSALME